jgi:predicted metal-binding membrane protein
MYDVRANRLSVQRNVILGLLLALATGAWVVLLWQSADADMDMTTSSPTMGLRMPLFFGDLGDHDGGYDVSDRRTYDPYFS